MTTQRTNKLLISTNLADRQKVLEIIRRSSHGVVDGAVIFPPMPPEELTAHLEALEADGMIRRYIPASVRGDENEKLFECYVPSWFTDADDSGQLVMG